MGKKFRIEEEEFNNLVDLLGEDGVSLMLQDYKVRFKFCLEHGTDIKSCKSLDSECNSLPRRILYIRSICKNERTDNRTFIYQYWLNIDDDSSGDDQAIT